MTAITIPADTDAWLELIRVEVPTGAARWATLAARANERVQQMSPEALDEAFFNQVIDSSGADVYNREVVLNSLLEAFKDEPEEVEETGEIKALKVEIYAAFSEAFPGIGGWSKKKRDATLATAVYQFGNWKAGRYTVSSVDEAVKQFTRRMRRTYPDVSITDDSFIWWSLMYWLRNKVEGKTALPRRKIDPSTYTNKDLIERYRTQMGLASSVDTHTLGWTVVKVLQPYSKVEEIPSDLMGAYVRRLQEVYSEHSSETSTRDGAEAVYEWYAENYLGQPALGMDPIADIAALEAYFVGKEGGKERFQIDAIKHGLADTVDQVKEGEVGKEQIIDTLRLNVRSYGHGRFSGGGRNRMLAMVEVIDAERGKGLTAEEWKERYARFLVRLGAVAGRYGENHNMCPTLEKATIELGHTLTRFPEGRTVTFKSEDLIIQVPVETWSTNDHTLKDKAKSKWGFMTPEERKAAVVEQKGVHVAWDKMTVA